MKTVRIKAGDYCGPDLERNRLYRFTQRSNPSEWEVRWLPGPTNREDRAAVDAWSEEILTSILGEDDLDWEHDGYFDTKREAIASVERPDAMDCRACVEPYGPVRTHTCGLKGLQSLLPRI